jgi:ribonuclease T
VHVVAARAANTLGTGRRSTEYIGLQPISYSSAMTPSHSVVRIAERFRGFLPVVVDVETGGFDAERDALLEIAVVVIGMDAQGRIFPQPAVSTHVHPFPGANIDPKALEITGIDPDHPFRNALEERPALEHVFAPVRAAMRAAECQRAILVGHNAAFDLGFLNAAVRRTGHKRNPFHPFSNFDTVTLAGLAYGQTVLARAVAASGSSWDPAQAHSAVYDTERTAELFCGIINRWKEISDFAAEHGYSTGFDAH